MTAGLACSGPAHPPGNDRSPRPESLPAAESGSPEEHFLEAYGGLLCNVDAEGLVDYLAIQNAPELDAANRHLATVSGASLESRTEAAQIAFWINAYNFLTLRLIADHYPIQSSLLTSLVFPRNSIRQIPGAWDAIRFQVAGKALTLDQIEHEILRKHFSEPRIHVALVCAARSCPKLRTEPYQGTELTRQLDEQVLEFLGDPEKFSLDRRTGAVRLSSIFKWYGDDFIPGFLQDEGFGQGPLAERAVLSFVANFLSAQDAAFLRQGSFEVDYLDYDWALNEQP